MGRKGIIAKDLAHRKQRDIFLEQQMPFSSSKEAEDIQGIAPEALHPVPELVANEKVKLIACKRWHLT